MARAPITGLVLTGGGARAAYQVGVLRALLQLRREAGVPLAQCRINPFDVICGTSAGAINGAALASRCDDVEAAVDALHGVWHHFHADQVYCADTLGVLRTGSKWLTMLSLGWALRRMCRLRPRSLLDNAPLADLLHDLVPMERLPHLLAQRHLQALAITASGYGSGEHVTFYMSGAPVTPWTRSQRIAVPARLEVPHLLASSAIPFVFPATQLPRRGAMEWFGDGSMRQMAPISPAIHLGAERVLVIGSGRMQEPTERLPAGSAYPSIAQIAGHALSGIFLDALAVDIERLERINRTLALLPPAHRTQSALRPVQALVIAPSQRLDDLAGEHIDALPAPVRALLRGVGVQQGRGARLSRGSTLASYLLFEAPYTRTLIALGEADTRARRDEVCAFFGWGTGGAAGDAIAVAAGGHRATPGGTEGAAASPAGAA